MTETDPEKRLIGYARISTYGQMLDTQLSRAHLCRRRRPGIGRLTDPTAAAQLWLPAGSSCPTTDMAKTAQEARKRPFGRGLRSSNRRVGQLLQLGFQQIEIDRLGDELRSAVLLSHT